MSSLMKALGLTTAIAVAVAISAPSAATAAEISSTTRADHHSIEVTEEQLRKETAYLASLSEAQAEAVVLESLEAFESGEVHSETGDTSPQAVPVFAIPAVISCAVNLITGINGLEITRPQGFELALDIADLIVGCIPGGAARPLANFIWDNRKVIGRALIAAGLSAGLATSLCGDSSCKD